MAEIFPVLALIFLASSVLLLVFNRFRHPAIPAYILAGVAIGAFIDGSDILFLIELGIGFLVFIFGVKTEPERIKSLAGESMLTTAIQIGFIGTAAFLTGLGIGFNYVNAFYLASAAALSSSLIGLEILEDPIRLDILHGRLAESIHLIQDIVAIGGILLVTAPSYTLAPVSLNVYHSLVLLTLALVFRQFLLPSLVEFTEGSTELLMMTSLSILTVFVGGSQLLNISPIVGAFTAGIAAARFPHNLEVLEVMSSFKDFFSTVFFVSLGALISFPSKAVLVISAFLIITTAFIKPAITALSLLSVGYDKRTAYLAGLSLDQISEFALIMAILAFISGSIHPALFDAIILSSAVTMVVSSYTTRHQEQIYLLLSRYELIDPNSRKIEKRTQVKEGLENHIIVLGYDPQGRRIAEELERKGEDFVVIENDPEKITEVGKNHDNYVFGDAMDFSTWRNARMNTASLIISTAPIQRISNRILELETEADIILRSESIVRAAEFLERGATYVEVPDVAASEKLTDHLVGVMDNRNYAEELRRRKLLELRQYMRDEES